MSWIPGRKWSSSIKLWHFYGTGHPSMTKLLYISSHITQFAHPLPKRENSVTYPAVVGTSEPRISAWCRPPHENSRPSFFLVWSSVIWEIRSATPLSWPPKYNSGPGQENCMELFHLENYSINFGKTVTYGDPLSGERRKECFLKGYAVASCGKCVTFVGCSTSSFNLS